MGRKPKKQEIPKVRIINPEAIPQAEINLARIIAQMIKEGKIKID